MIKQQPKNAQNDFPENTSHYYAAELGISLIKCQRLKYVSTGHFPTDGTNSESDQIQRINVAI